MAKFALLNVDLPTEATRPLYAGVGATDLVVGYVRDVVADVQKRIVDVQKDVQTRVTGFEFQPKALRDQAVIAVSTSVDALSKDAKARRAAIESRVSELQTEATGTYADLAKRGETLVERIRKQESTKATVSSAKTTSAKAKTTKTQATKATKTTAKKTAKKASTTAKKTSTAPKSSAKATTTAAKKTASSAATAATSAATKVGD